MEYRNIDIQPGARTNLSFEIEDSTGIPVNISSIFVKLEIFDTQNKLVYASSSPTKLGNVATFILNSNDTQALDNADLLSYRVIYESGSTPVDVVAWSGYISTDLKYDKVSTYNSNITLPSGSIYVVGPATLLFDTWYAVSSVNRFLVSGVGSTAITGRRVNGEIVSNLRTHTTVLPDELQWIPDLEDCVDFKIIRISGSHVVKYLP